MRIKNDTACKLFDSMIESCVEEIQGIGNGNCAERLAEILWDDYPRWSVKKCKRIAKWYYERNYDHALKKAREEFEPTAQQEAVADVRREAIYGR